jgi:cobalt-zinc-cadmium efflux system membrane fusion protein
MTRNVRETAAVLILAALFVAFSGCSRGAAADPAAGAPPAPNVTNDVDVTLFKLDHPEQFPLVAATARPTASELTVTGTVTPDVARNVPVISLASGRVVAINARLGDTVTQGQPMFTVRSDDISGGFSDYRKAVEDELLANKQLVRTRDLYAHGAMALQDVENAENTENKAKVDVETFAEHLRLLGNDPDHPVFNVQAVAPISGIVTDQQITNAAYVQSYGTNPFTISDLSYVWIICDVYENDLATVKMGDSADIRLNAYPNEVFKGTISNIGSIMDPNIRTAKVRLEVKNPGNMRLGMFVKATFKGQTTQMHTIVPASAIMHMHDRDFVFVPAPDQKFRRVEIVSGDVLQENTSLQEVKSGLRPGDQVVTNALVLDHVIAQ